MDRFAFEFYRSGKAERVWIDGIDKNDAKQEFISQFGPVSYKIIDVQDVDELDETLDEIDDFCDGIGA